MSLIKENKTLIKSFSGYTIANLLNAAVPFLLLPFLTVYLTPEDYGILSNIDATFMVLVPLIGINLSAAASRQFVNDDINFSVYISSCMRIIFLNTLIVFGILFIIGNWLSGVTDIPFQYILILPFHAIIHNIIELVLTLFRMKNQPLFYGIFRVLRTSIEILISVLLILYADMKWEGRFYGILSAAALFCIVALVYLLRQKTLVFSFDKNYVKKFLRFGIPLIPHALSGVLIMFSDKIIVTELIGISENGIYSVAFQIGMVIALFQNSFNQAWVPYFFNQLKKGFDKVKMVKFTYVYFLVLLLLSLFLWLGTPVIFYFIDASFSEGSEYVFWIGLGFAFNGMYKMMVNYIIFEERTKIVAINTIITAVVNIILNLILIPHYGLLGAAIASTISFVIQFFVTWYFSNKVYPMPWNLFKGSSDN